jgi:hypothetical protein
MTMMSTTGSKGVTLATISGIPIQLQYSCFLLVCIEVLAVMWQYHEPVFTILMFVLYGPVLLGTILIVSKRIPLFDSWCQCLVDTHSLLFTLTYLPSMNLDMH